MLIALEYVQLIVEHTTMSVTRGRCTTLVITFLACEHHHLLAGAKLHWC